MASLACIASRLHGEGYRKSCAVALCCRSHQPALIMAATTYPVISTKSNACEGNGVAEVEWPRWVCRCRTRAACPLANVELK